jgi:hypothetical protein
MGNRVGGLDPMMRAVRPSRGKLLFAAIWAAGVAVVCWRVRPGPRDGWQPAADEHICGLLQDGKTLVVAKLVRRQTDTEQPVYGGPVLLRDIDSGAIHTTLFSEDDRFDSIRADWFTDVLHIGYRLPGTGPYPSHFLLYDANTGRELTELNRSAPHRTTYWEFAPDGRFVAACGTDEDGRHRIAICDPTTGRRLCEFPDCSSGRFSPDGRRFGANKGRGDILVFEVPSGRQISELPNTTAPNVSNYFRQFSADGRLALDDQNQVWEVDRAIVVFTAPTPGHGLTLFGIDGNTVVTVGASTTEAWLAHYDIGTGQELVHRRMPLISLPPKVARVPIFSLGTGGARSDGVYTAQFYGEELPLPPQFDWVRRFPTIRSWVQPRSRNVSVVLV